MKPSNPLIFDNPSSAFVQALKEVILQAKVNYPVLNGVRIATKKLTPQQRQVSNQIIITSTGAQTIENGLAREQGFNINIWCKSFEVAEELALVIEACLTAIRGQQGIKWVEVDLSAVDVSTETTEEQRFITCTALVTAKSFSLL